MFLRPCDILGFWTSRGAMYPAPQTVEKALLRPQNNGSEPLGAHEMHNCWGPHVCGAALAGPE